MRSLKHLTSALLVLCLADVTWATHPPRLRKPRRGAQMVVGPTVVPRNGEVTDCHYFKLPSARDMAVNRIDIKVRGGSHHVHLYRPNDPAMTLSDGSETCNYALDFEKWGLILATQTPELHWRLPKGVAFHMKAGEQLAAQTHYVDTGLLKTKDEGWSVINVHATPMNKVDAWAGSFFGQDRDVVVPPHSTATATTRCVFPRPVKVLGLTGHYHFRGQQFTANVWDGVSTGAQIYRNEGYTEPAFDRFGEDAPEIPGVEWTCTYDNPTDETYTFGPFTEQNEHCNMFMFYYPAATPHEFMTCVQKDGEVTVKTHGN